MLASTQAQSIPSPQDPPTGTPALWAASQLDPHAAREPFRAAAPPAGRHPPRTLLPLGQTPLALEAPLDGRSLRNPLRLGGFPTPPRPHGHAHGDSVAPSHWVIWWLSGFPTGLQAS